ncbi:protein of unknown function [Streptomyces sp. DvalAA-14]|uniref:DUF5134 domain-containing protein n=1 Tax=unclassified Streptomyces TaxID=2593676 RepID=UPI00081B1127|nr:MULTISPECIES: DUF5134 domain-containing protein [unclassified Streptomyces]MYS21030.1 DUF5134 domain-containing protein [Streptomyces sp. SID4948]SCD82629.1 protein of unknown function [Streptomyces sp. DvalAA-14]
MQGTPLVAWLLVALGAAVALSCLLRREARAEAVTSAGMAVTAVPMSVVDPGPWGAAALAAVFTLAGLHSLLGRAPHRMHHAVCSAAMVYMTVAVAAAGPGHAEHLGAGAPLLTGLLLLYFAGYVLRTGISLIPGPAHPAGTSAPASGGAVLLRHAPEVALACRVSMALGMFAMLLAL